MKTIIATAITLLVIALIIGSAALYIIRKKKKGAKCIGCPCSGTCLSAMTGCCSGTDAEKN